MLQFGFGAFEEGSVLLFLPLMKELAVYHPRSLNHRFLFFLSETFAVSPHVEDHLFSFFFFSLLSSLSVSELVGGHREWYDGTLRKTETLPG